MDHKLDTLAKVRIAAGHLRGVILATVGGIIAFNCLGICARAQTANPPVPLPVTMNTLAGTGLSGVANGSSFSNDLRAIAVDGQDNIYVDDAGNSKIWGINAATGALTVVAGGAATTCAKAVTGAGDGCIAATQTILKAPRGIAVDKVGNIYIADYNYSLVHVVNKQTGIMSLLAGYVAGPTKTGTAGYTGDGGPANQAEVKSPRGVRVDNNGNIFVVDTGNNCVREITPDGKIHLIVGTTTAGFSGDGGQAGAATLNTPTDIVFDSANNAYVVDFNNDRIRKVASPGGGASIATTSIITTIIGSGVAATSTAPAFPIAGTSLAMGNPTKIAIDSYGNLYFEDTVESVVYFYDAIAQTVFPIAGEYGFAGTLGGNFSVCAAATNTIGDGCPATQAVFYQNSSALAVTIDSKNNLYISDPYDYRIRIVTTGLSLPVQTVGQSVTQNAELHFAPGDKPASSGGIAVGSSLGDFTIASTPACTTSSDTTTNCTFQVAYKSVRPGLRAAPLNVQSVASHRTLALTGSATGAFTAFDPGTATTLGSGLSKASGTAVDNAGNAYIADTGNNRVVEVSAVSQTQTVIAGTGKAGYTGDGGPATAATLNAPAGVAISASGVIFIADTGNNVIRAIDPLTGILTTYAGGGSVCSSEILVDAVGDGCLATAATLKAPSGLVTDSYNNLYIADTGNNLIRRVDSATGYIDLDAGGAVTICTGSTDALGDGCPALAGATFNGPTGLAIDTNSNVYVADTGNNVIREISLSTGLVTAVAGSGQTGFGGDGGLASAAQLKGPTAVALDPAGDYYIADTGNDAVRVVNQSTGFISTLLGVGGIAGATGGSGSASQLGLAAPSGLALDASGNLYVSDTGNSRFLQDNRNNGTVSFGLGNLTVPTLSQTAIVSNIGNASLTFANSPFYVLSGSNAADFIISTSASSACVGAGTVAVGASCTLSAEFDAPVPGVLSAPLTAPSNAVNQATASLLLTGTGAQLLKSTISLALTSPAAGGIAYGQVATFVASVAAAVAGSGTPTGSVTFSVDGANQPAATLGSNGTAAISLNLATGSHSIVALYTGNTFFATSNASLSETVTPAATTTTVALAAGVLTAQVTSSTTGIPGGTVNFVTGSTVVGSAQVGATGQATINIATFYLVPASYPVVAQYQGALNYQASNSTAQTVVIVPPTLAVSASPNAMSVAQGSVTTTILTVIPSGNVFGNVSLSCSGLPANTTCSFLPTLLWASQTPYCTVASNAPSTAQCTAVTFTTNAPPSGTQSLVRSPFSMGGLRGLAVAMLFPCTLVFVGTRKRKRLQHLLLPALLLLCASQLMSGCAATIANLTPTGTSTVMVTLSGPDVATQTIPVTLTVVTGPQRSQ